MFSKLTLLLFLLMSVGTNLFGQVCATVPEPAATEEQKLKLQKAFSNYQQNNDNADNIIWYGRHLGYNGEYAQAIDIFDQGIEKFPRDARMYRHRGHRYLTVRCFDKAIADFEKAAKLVRNKPDETEPDGMPNAKNIPTSTLQTNIYYHLGLAYFFKNNIPKAEAAFRACLELSKNDDMKIATANWLNLILQAQGKKEEAKQLWQSLPQEPNLIENFDYWLLLRLYYVDKPTTKEQMQSYLDELNTQRRTILSAATTAFGIGYYCKLNNLNEQAEELFEKVLSSGQWASFGFIAAETTNGR